MKCAQCGGTGQVVLSNSWFIADGFRRERCGICGGSGESTYIGDRIHNRVQSAKRDLVARFGRLAPKDAAESHDWLDAVNDAWRAAKRA